MPTEGSIRARVVLIEGLPGSGKTSLAGWLCSEMRALGIDACWIPELQRDHPVIDRPTMRTARHPGYADRCAARWQSFSRQVQGLRRPSVFVLEGCLFQSSVRFLVEHERPFQEIVGYQQAVESCLAPLRPLLIYLTQADTEAFLKSEVIRRKGIRTLSRIAEYSETTPFAVSRGLRGGSALVSLYATYRRTCDDLVDRSTLAHLELDAVRLSEAQVRERSLRAL